MDAQAKVGDIIDGLLAASPCCDLAAVPIAGLAERERRYFAAHLPGAQSALALAHHVRTEQEWTWYQAPGALERCDADDHLRQLGEAIRRELAERGLYAELVPYPGQSGLRFRDVAVAAGLGRIGINAFLFHPAWGPWVHLRVLGIGAVLDLRPRLTGDQLCNECGLCIAACPAGAIAAASFNGRRCREYRGALGEYDPHGPEGLLPYCLRCAWVCPRGENPAKLGRFDVP